MDKKIEKVEYEGLLDFIKDCHFQVKELKVRYLPEAEVEEGRDGFLIQHIPEDKNLFSEGFIVTREIKK